MEEFIQSLLSFRVLPEEEVDFFRKALEPKTAEKGEKLLEPGEDASRIVLLEKGVLKSYLLTEDGKPIVKSFTFPGQLLMDYEAFFRQKPATHFVEALTPCKYYLRPSNFSQTLYQRHPGWYGVDLEIMQRFLLKLSKRETEFLSLRTAHLYKRFMQESGTLADRIPQKDIASFLGVTPESLSRIIREL